MTSTLRRKHSSMGRRDEGYQNWAFVTFTDAKVVDEVLRGVANGDKIEVQDADGYTGVRSCNHPADYSSCCGLRRVRAVVLADCSVWLAAQQSHSASIRLM